MDELLDILDTAEVCLKMAEERATHKFELEHIYAVRTTLQDSVYYIKKDRNTLAKLSSDQQVGGFAPV